MRNREQVLEDALEQLYYAAANIVVTDDMPASSVQTFLRAEQKAERVLRLLNDERRALNGV